MKIISNPKEMQSASLFLRGRHKKIAFVPTMGSLHEGHLALLKKGRELGDILVLSLFVNPTQFGPHEDFKRYPRDAKEDLEKAKSAGADFVFMPPAKEMYGENFETFAQLENLPKFLCGKSRSTHFRGVATVVAKLFNIILPHTALFGEKDYQQLKIIQKMVRDLNFPIEIVSIPIVREKDGLAMSSRNQYLTPQERQSALSISQSLTIAQAMVAEGIKNKSQILNTVSATLLETKKIRIDYVTLSDPETLEELKQFKLPVLLAIACFINKIRLIDNRILHP